MIEDVGVFVTDLEREVDEVGVASAVDVPLGVTVAVDVTLDEVELDGLVVTKLLGDSDALAPSVTEEVGVFETDEVNVAAVDVDPDDVPVIDNVGDGVEVGEEVTEVEVEGVAELESVIEELAPLVKDAVGVPEFD